jgi:hypothetical protein
MSIRQSFFSILCSLLFAIITFSCNNSNYESKQSKEIIKVEYPETYELANIILALAKK